MKLKMDQELKLTIKESWITETVSVLTERWPFDGTLFDRKQ